MSQESSTLTKTSLLVTDLKESVIWSIVEIFVWDVIEPASLRNGQI